MDPRTPPTPSKSHAMRATLEPLDRAGWDVVVLDLVTGSITRGTGNRDEPKGNNDG